MSSTAHRSDDEYSRGPAAGRGLRSAHRVALATALSAALAGALALIYAALGPVLRTRSAGRTQSALDRTGIDLHGPALLVLAGLALVLLVIGARGALAAAVGLASCGIAALVIALAIDLPDVGRHGLVGDRLLAGTIVAGPGAYAELLGGVLLLLAGGLRGGRGGRGGRPRPTLLRGATG